MKIRILSLIQAITAIIIFIFRIFYKSSSKNIFNNINTFFNYEMPETNSVIYFFLIMSLFASAFLLKKNIINQIILCILIMLNLFIIFLSIKVW
ncbi:hypothetical protein J2799_000389 [Chryseobacterium vietnamense]|nr:hypothetical protein [Chryseobacterium vietnamense]